MDERSGQEQVILTQPFMTGVTESARDRWAAASLWEATLTILRQKPDSTPKDIIDFCLSKRRRYWGLPEVIVGNVVNQKLGEITEAGNPKKIELASKAANLLYRAGLVK